MRMLNVGIMGALISNENMGCVALTYSLIQMLENISKNVEIKFSYRVFEFDYSKEKYAELQKNLNIDSNRIRFVPVGFCYLENWKLMIKSAKVNAVMLSELHKCDLVIDLTQGDSFTDIYGTERFYRLTSIKEITEKMGIPLILGPQTYGPFINDRVKKKAGKVIKRAQRVISRDEKSRDYLKSFIDCDVEVTTDLAFALPYKESLHRTENKIRVGINPSVLLFSDKTEKTKLMTSLKTDYDLYIQEVIKKVSSNSMFEVHLIPHVGNDAVEKFKNFPNVICYSAFSNPIEAKSLISTMDVFIGSRMHATIAAFSSAVATIPVAYSRKFIGLYENLGYTHIVDLCQMDTNTAIGATMSLLRDYQNLKKEAFECMKNIGEAGARTEQIIENEIKKIIKERR